MAVNVKLGVDLSSFNSGIREGQSILKGLNAEMKATEAEFKATGNAEKALEQKTKTLNSQLQVQKGIVDQAQKALKAMDEAGVKPTDAAYQKLYATMMNATAGMNETQAALNNLTASEQTAAAGANNLTNSVNSIGKKISLDQVISGIDSITRGLENAAKKAVSLGEAIWNNVMDSARLSDDILTQAGILDMTPEQYQQYKGVFNTIGEVTISEWAATKRKIEKVMVDPNSQIDVLRALGFTQIVDGKESNQEIVNIADNWEGVFWQVGSELQKRVESGELTTEMADVYGEALFGKKYSSMKNLLKLGQEGFEAALKEQNIISDEALEKDAALNDAVIKLQDSFNALKAEVTSALAPALTDAANALDGVLGKVLEYLKTEEGKEMLKSLSDSVSSLFEDLGKIDPEKVVKSFTTVFNDLVSGLQWIVENKSTLVGALQAIVVGWGGLSLFGGALQILRLIEGLQGLGILGGGKAAADAASGTASGGNWLSGVMPGIGSKLPALASWTSVNGGPVWDWLTHESPLGTIFQGVESIGDWWSRMLKEQQERTDTFGDNWNPNSADANVIMKNAGNTIRFWDDFWSQVFTGGTGWNWGPQQEGTGSDWTDEEAQNLADAIAKRTEEMEGVTVDVEPEAPIDSAQKISEQIGTVQVPVQLLMMGGGSGMVPFPIEGFHANGLPFVPFDNYLALLHRGERVMPAREVASRNFSSNLYVENMNMNGGLSADALAAAIAGRNRRMMAGYGS